MAVPVKELSAIPKATELDLSCNLLTIIGPDFCSLTHLVKIDLSKNQLTELPENFGDLQKLQHLDLYQNKLKALPVSFCRLNALKWLDIRDNQLSDSELLAAGGDCLNETQCRNCAKRVVLYMKKVQSDEERERQKKLRELRDREALQKAEEERENQRKRAEKKAEKERRRQEMLQKAAHETGMVNNGDSVETLGKQPASNGQPGIRAKTRQSGLSCLQIGLAMLLLTVAAVCGLYMYCTTAQFVNDYCTVGVNWFNGFVQNVYYRIDVALGEINTLYGKVLASLH